MYPHPEELVNVDTGQIDQNDDPNHTATQRVKQQKAVATSKNGQKNSSGIERERGGKKRGEREREGRERRKKKTIPKTTFIFKYATQDKTQICQK